MDGDAERGRPRAQSGGASPAGGCPCAALVCGRVLIDVLIVLLAVAMALWGYSRGMTPGLLSAVAFGVGAVLGSRIAPQLLADGLHDRMAPLLALPGALLVGALLAAGVERAGFRLRRLLRGRYLPDALGGAVLGTFVGVVLAWAIAAAAARSDGLEGTVRSSNVIERLNSVLPPPGPVLTATRRERPSRLPRAKPREISYERRVKQDPQVRSAARSVVNVEARACDGHEAGSGWIAADGIVMTTAHVVRGSRRVRVRVGGRGHPRKARPIYFNNLEDISVLRVPDLGGRPALRIEPRHRIGASVAVQGFPAAEGLKTRAGWLGPVIQKLKPSKDAGTRRRPSAILRSALGVGPGSSGGPVVNRNGRVVGMIFAGSPVNTKRDQFAVPGFELRAVLQRAVAHGRTVGTGGCHRMHRGR